MNILAVDTSGNVCSVAVLADEKIISETYLDNKRNHSVTLGPMIDECMKRSEMTLDDIDLFGCAIGPGSFTGLRIGAGIIKAFCHASGKKCVAVNTLDALAQNLEGDKRVVCSVIDARRTDVYSAVYNGSNRVSQYRAMQIDELLEELKGQEVVFVGDGSIRFKELIETAGFSTANTASALQRAGSVGILSYRNAASAVSAYELEPFYLRKTQAERVYEQKHRGER